MKLCITALVVLVLVVPVTTFSQNCCAPAVPQQGILGETTALPHTLEIGLHYEYLRSSGMYNGSESIIDSLNTKTIWNRTTMTLSYGIVSGIGVSAIIPYQWKEKSRDILGSTQKYTLNSNGLGDITLFARFSPLPRSYVNYREISIGLGIKIPTGRNDLCCLPEEIQPGTGSWDYDFSLSFYQGFEPVDFYLSGTYILTTVHDDYEFGNQFSYLLTSNIHLKERLDISAALSGTVKARDADGEGEISSTGRHQLWLVPAIQVQAIPEKLRLQVYFEHPIYQNFNEIQLGSDYNIRMTAVYLFPLSKSDEE